MVDLENYAWVVQVMWILIPVLVALAFRKAWVPLKAKYEASTTADQRAIIEGVARMVVLAVEGYMKSEPGARKYAEAEGKVNAILASKGVPTTVAEVRTAIEAAVYDELNRYRVDPLAEAEVKR